MPRNRQPTPLIPVRWKVNFSTAAASLPKLAAFVFQQDLTSNKVIKCCCVSKQYTLGVAVLFFEEIRFGGHFLPHGLDGSGLLQTENSLFFIKAKSHNSCWPFSQKNRHLPNTGL